MLGRVLNIQRFSLHDGPGIRTTVFLQGCPLSCLWCHNPESRPSGSSLLFYRSKCLQCQSCLSSCQHGAVTLSHGELEICRARCRGCGACALSCPSGALGLVGKEMSSVEVLSEALKDRPFFEESGGGVTFSGGEPLAQPAFLFSLLAGARAHGLHTALDTSGYAPWEAFELVSPLTDTVLFDLKHMDSEEHKRLTGVPNELILANLRRLSAMHRGIILRMPVIPGLNDSQDNIAATSALARELGLKTLHLLPYHAIAEGKYAALGLESGKKFAPTASTTEWSLGAVAGLMRQEGLEVKIGG